MATARPAMKEQGKLTIGAADPPLNKTQCCNLDQRSPSNSTTWLVKFKHLANGTQHHQAQKRFMLSERDMKYKMKNDLNSRET